MKRLILISCLGMLMVLASPALAVPVEDIIIDSNPLGQDNLEGPWSHELGVGFPPEDEISASDTESSYVPCPRDYTGQGTNFEVTITNLTNVAWKNMTYVADPETTITNDDLQLVNGCLAFLIDNVGLNQPLTSESMTPDLIFEPGETWTFVIQEYSNLFALPPSALASIGLVGNQSGGDEISSGSIIAVPEPATIALLGLGSLTLLRKRRA